MNDLEFGLALCSAFNHFSIRSNSIMFSFFKIFIALQVAFFSDFRISSHSSLPDSSSFHTVKKVLIKIGGTFRFGKSYHIKITISAASIEDACLQH